jgi:7-keto-8-aminopelargonate synthetase-like enzyme
LPGKHHSLQEGFIFVAYAKKAQAANYLIGADGTRALRWNSKQIGKPTNIKINQNKNGMITLQGGIGNYTIVDNIRYSHFAGNNYLGLANHPDMVKNAIHSLEKYGINFSASRQTTGTSDLHLELERQLAEFKDQQAAIIFATGYMGNKLLLDSLKDEYTAVFADSLAHPSILDGIPKEISAIHFYGHCDPVGLDALLKKHRGHRPLIITDGVFALTGEIAPLDQIYALAEKYNAIVVVDDAHATGVLGKNGRGTPEHFALDGAKNLYQSETMSKAMGGYGGFISSEKETIDRIRCQSRFYGASTALPPPIVAAGCASLKMMKEHPELRGRLMEHAALIRKGVRELDFDTADGITPIIPLFFTDWQKAKGLSDFLKENHIIAPAVDYPVTLDKFIVRITVSALHTTDQIEELLSVLQKWRDKHSDM